MTTTNDEPPANDNEPRHIPVLAAEVLADLDLQPGEIVLDGTVGLGGHARKIAAKIGPTGLLIGLDRDPFALAIAMETLTKAPTKITLIQARFSELQSYLNRLGIPQVNCVLLDIGTSSMQMDTPERGFSFQHDGPLDMRMNPTRGQTAADIIANTPETELADLIYQYGEERYSRRIAKTIVEHRQQMPIITTGQLAKVVEQAVRRRGRIHPATRVFQALRIVVNAELEELEQGILAARNVLCPGGRLSVISFHSLEDRILKWKFREWEAAGSVRLVRKKVVKPSHAECCENRRARSAKLRTCIKL